MKEKKGQAITVAVSGGFDPPHVGHLRMFREAKELGDRLVVILNNDNWLLNKKNYVFMPESERKEMIEGFDCVDEVVLTKHKENADDMSVCASLSEIKPNIFGNGGDRHSNNVPEVAVCEKIGCDLVFNVGAGGKVQSSSWLVEKIKKKQEKVSTKLNLDEVKRPWGSYSILRKDSNCWVKKIFVDEGARLSLQSHEHRNEVWYVLSGKVLVSLGQKSREAIAGEFVYVPKRTKHRIEGITKACVLEVAFGRVLERDIVRYEDDYGRSNNDA